MLYTKEKYFGKFLWKGLEVYRIQSLMKCLVFICGDMTANEVINSIHLRFIDQLTVGLASTYSAEFIFRNHKMEAKSWNLQPTFFLVFTVYTSSVTNWYETIILNKAHTHPLPHLLDSKSKGDTQVKVEEQEQQTTRSW